MPEPDNDTILNPSGELVIRTIAMPRDTNANGDIFGGWLVSQMDLGGAILATQIAKTRVATVAINNLAFIRPVNVGDIICCYANLVKLGTTSLTIQVQAWTISATQPERKKVTEGIFVFVALNESRKPVPIVSSSS